MCQDGNDGKHTFHDGYQACNGDELTPASCLVADEADHKQFSYAVLVPTYPPHKLFYCNLIDSLLSSRTDQADEPVLLVSVFSSDADRRDILNPCGVCNKDTLRRAGIGMTSLIFDVPYEEGRSKFTYQSAKKLWAVEQLPSNMLVMVVDSDSLFLPHKVPLTKRFDEHARVLYRGGEVGPADTKLNKTEVMQAANGFVGSTVADFLFELPMFARPYHVRALFDSLALKLGVARADVGSALSRVDTNVFEVVLLNTYVLETDPDYYRQVQLPPGTLMPLFELPPEERPPLDIPSLGFTWRHLVDAGQCCETCCMMMHMDRTCTQPPGGVCPNVVASLKPEWHHACLEQLG